MGAMTVLIVVLLSFLQLPLGHEALSVMWNWTRSEKDNCKAVWSTGAYKSRELRMNGQDPFLQYSGFDQKGNMKMKDVLLIHVGKTGGTSVSWSMRANKIAITEIHVHPVLPKMMQRHKYVFVTIRDPIERFISAFNFNHPLGTHPKNSDVYSCYSNVSAAAAAILDLGECSRLMRGASDQLDLHTEMVSSNKYLTSFAVTVYCTCLGILLLLRWDPQCPEEPQKYICSRDEYLR